MDRGDQTPLSTRPACVLARLKDDFCLRQRPNDFLRDLKPVPGRRRYVHDHDVRLQVACRPHQGLIVVNVRYDFEIARKFPSELVLTPELEFGFLLHDVGKVAIPDAILYKPEPLTAEERALMERHPVIGSEIVHGIESGRINA